MTHDRETSASSRLASLLVRWAGRVLPSDELSEWREAMRAEVGSVADGPARIAFAMGCLAAAVRQRARAGSTPIAVRVGGLGIAAVFVGQAVGESHGWLNGNEASRRFYLLVVAVVVGLLVTTTLRVARRAFATTTLTVGAGGGLIAGSLWAAVVWLSPTMPRDASGGLVVVAMCTALSAGLVAYLTRVLRECCAAALLAATVGTALVFSTAELFIQVLPGRIPDIVGPVMPAGSTTAQVLRENRIEIVDGYVGLLFVLAGLLTGLLLISLAGRRGLSDHRFDSAQPPPAGSSSSSTSGLSRAVVPARHLSTKSAR